MLPDEAQSVRPSPSRQPAATHRSVAAQEPTPNGTRGSSAPVFPSELEPVVWGTETSTSAEAVPPHTPITRTEHEDQVLFAWGTADPPVGARYRLNGACAPSLTTAATRRARAPAATR